MGVGEGVGNFGYNATIGTVVFAGEELGTAIADFDLTKAGWQAIRDDKSIIWDLTGGALLDSVEACLTISGSAADVTESCLETATAAWGAWRTAGSIRSAVTRLPDVDAPTPAPTSALDDLASVACRSNSFVPGTLVLMADGATVPIEDVEIGDWVWAHDPETGETGPRQVVDTIVGDGDKQLVDVGVLGDTVTATDGHPFWVANDGAWTDADDLKIGDRLLLADGRTTPVVGSGERVAEQQVHNLTVDGIHTYYVEVGGEAVLVHNCSPRAWDIAMKAEQTPGRMAELGFDSVDALAMRIDEIVDSSRGILRDDGSLLYRDGDLFVSIPDTARLPGTIFRATDQYWEDQLARSVYSG